VRADGVLRAVKAERWVSRVLLIAVAFGALGLFVTLVHGIAMVLFPLQIDYAEGVCLQLADTIARGQALYRDPSQYPWLVSPYTPLYLWTSAMLGKGFFAGRLISLVAALGCAALVAFATWRRGHAAAPAAALTVFVCSALFTQWSSYYRVDFLGLFWELAGLVMVERCLLEKRSIRSANSVGNTEPHGDSAQHGSDLKVVAAAAVLFTLAFYTKQTFVLGLVASVGTLWFVSRRDAIALAGASAVLLAIPYALIDYASGGYLYNLFFRYNAVPWSASYAWLWVSGYLRTVAAGILLALWWHLTRRSVWSVYFFLAVLTLIGVGRTGSYYNHFLPFHAAMAIGAGLAIGALLGPEIRPREKTFSYGVVMGCVLLLVQVALGFYQPLRPTLEAPAKTLTAEVPELLGGRFEDRLNRLRGDVGTVARDLSQYPGPVFAENLGLPVLIGRPSIGCDPITLFTLAEIGLWDEKPLIKMIEKREIAVITLQRLTPDNPRVPPRILARILQHYEPKFKIFDDTVLFPKAPAVGPSN